MVGVLPSLPATFSMAARKMRLACAALSKLSSSLSAIAARTVPAQVRKIDYLGKMPTVNPKPVKVSDDPKQMLRFDLDNENETIRNYRERIRRTSGLV
jgi:bacterioferritin (cytochrome b1)